MILGVVISIGILALRSVSSEPSLDDWHRLDDALYLVDNVTLLNYDQAQSLCQEYGANLPRIDSDEIQSFLTSFISPPFSNTRCFWIGANDRQIEGQFMWLDGTPVQYDGWAKYQPDNARNRQDCACLWSSEDPDRHGRWDDDGCTVNRNLICQKGIYSFQLSTIPSNPGYAYVSCSVDVNLAGETLSSEDVRLSVGQTLFSTRSIPYSSTSFDGEVRNNSYFINDINSDDQIFCHVGDLPMNATSLLLAQFPPVDFYALPVLTSSPRIDGISSTSVIVLWSTWAPYLDSGNGPVLGYLVYIRTAGGEWGEVGGVDSGVAEDDSQRIKEFVLTGLEPNTAYDISVSAVREGIGGEGPRGPQVTVETAEKEPRLGALSRTWLLFGVSVAANFILIAVIVIICCRQQRKEKLSSLQTASPQPSEPKSDQYEIPMKPTEVDGNGADEHFYEGLQRSESRNKESFYMSIDNPNKVEYVNVPP